MYKRKKKLYLKVTYELSSAISVHLSAGYGYEASLVRQSCGYEMDPFLLEQIIIFSAK